MVNPDSTNELYDLQRDPDELLNIYHHPEMAQPVRSRMLKRLYTRCWSTGTTASTTG